MVPPMKIEQPGTAFILPSASLHFLAGPPINPMSAACACDRKEVRARADQPVGVNSEVEGSRAEGRGVKGRGLGSGRASYLAARVRAAGPMDA